MALLISNIYFSYLGVLSRTAKLRVWTEVNSADTVLFLRVVVVNVQRCVVCYLYVRRLCKCNLVADSKVCIFRGNCFCMNEIESTESLFEKNVFGR